MTTEKEQTQQYDGQHEEVSNPEGVQAEAQTEGQADAQVEAQPETAEAAEPAIDFKDKYIRAMAEMENLRKRATRDVEDARRFAVTGFARELLDVADNLERALNSINKDEDGGQLKTLCEGIEMVQNQLQQVFGKFKIEQTNPELGEKFNPELHQAMFEMPTEEYPVGTVAQVMQPGYVIAGRLLRPAMVGTAKAMAPQEKQQA